MPRTLIVAQGLELERILAAISKHGPRKVIILRNKKDVSDKLASIIEKLIKILKDQAFSRQYGIRLYPTLEEIDSDNYKVDFFNLPEVIASIHKIVQEETKKGNEVVIDISSGNKIIAIAMFLVAMHNQLQVTYCVASKYAAEEFDSLFGKPQPVEFQQIAWSSSQLQSLPSLPIEFRKIPFDILECLMAAGDRGVRSESELVLLKKKVKKPTLAPARVPKKDIISISRKISELMAYGYVKKDIRPGRRERPIVLTEDGKQILDLKVLYETNS